MPHRDVVIHCMPKMYLCCNVFNVKYLRDLEIWVEGRSRSIKIAPIDRPHTIYYWPATVTVILSCMVFELFDLE